MIFDLESDLDLLSLILLYYLCKFKKNVWCISSKLQTNMWQTDKQTDSQRQMNKQPNKVIFYMATLNFSIWVNQKPHVFAIPHTCITCHIKLLIFLHLVLILVSKIHKLWRKEAMPHQSMITHFCLTMLYVLTLIILK